MSIDINNTEPLYRQIANDIKKKITKGTLKTGDQLASQNELAVEYGVSLITIKKALADLTKEGLVSSKAGKGTFITNRKTTINFTKIKTIGFVLRDLESPFFSRILASAEKKISGDGYNLLISSTAGRSENEDRMIRHFLDIGVNGLIIASMSREYKASPLIRELREKNFPFVMVSYTVDEDIPYVGTDHEDGAYIATKHLINIGYRKIGYLNGVHGDSSLLGELRKKGFLKALKQYDIEFNPEYEYKFQLGHEWDDYHSGYEIGLKFFKSPNRPEAIFAFDDLVALGFQRAVLDKGLRVPQEVAIVGFDNIRRGVTAPVPLTTINQPLSDIGEIAVEMVINMINGITVPIRRILKPSLIVRQSCGAKLRGFYNLENDQFNSTTI